MKKAISIMTSILFIMGLTLTAHAALPSSNPVAGASEQVIRTINTSSGNETVTVYHNTDVSKEVFDLVNAERTKLGIAPLNWNSNLDEAALIRAIEQYFAPSHTRPDGTSYKTVSSYANGENVAGGNHPDYYLAVNLMSDWMSSSGHKSNILDTSYKSMAVACISTDTGTYYVHLFSYDKGDTGTTPVNPSNPITPPIVRPTNPNNNGGTLPLGSSGFSYAGNGSGGSSSSRSTGSEKVDTNPHTYTTPSSSSDSIEAVVDVTNIKAPENVNNNPSTGR